MAVRETDEQMKSQAASLTTDHDRVLEKAKKDYFKLETEQKKEMKLLTVSEETSSKSSLIRDNNVINLKKACLMVFVLKSAHH